MKLRVLLLASLAALTACKPFNGQLDVHRPTQFVLKKTIFGNVKKATIKPGKYRTELNFKSKDKAQLIVNADKEYKINLELPDGDSLPRYYGNISYSAKQINQPFDLKGFVDSKETYSDDFSGVETCTYIITKRVCRMVEEGREGHGIRNESDHRGDRRGDRRGDHRDRPQPPRRHQECKMENVTVYGQQRVTYHFKYTDSKVSLSLLEPGRSVILSEFGGTRHESDKIYTFQSVCR